MGRITKEVEECGIYRIGGGISLYTSIDHREDNQLSGRCDKDGTTLNWDCVYKK